jgi:hypothetical protein
VTSWREIERLRKNPAEFRAVAQQLLKLPELTEWETTFLESMSLRIHDDFTTRQGEKLLEIRDAAQEIESIHKFSVKSLMRGCHEARADLSEDDEEWIARLWERNRMTIKRRDSGRLLRCARQLSVIDDWVMT